MTCYLLHIMEDPDRDAYSDPNVRDVVGLLPKFYCANCQPIVQIAPSDSLKCMRRTGPCWKPSDNLCDLEPDPGTEPLA